MYSTKAHGLSINTKIHMSFSHLDMIESINDLLTITETETNNGLRADLI